MKAYQDASLAPARRAKALLEEMTLAEKVGQLNQRLYGFRIYERKCVNGEDTIELSEEFRQEVEKYSGLGVLYGLYRADPWADKDYETGLTGVLSKKAYNQVQRYVLEHSRLGIPVMMSSECPHGHQALDGYLLPVNLLAGATFDPAMVRAAYRVSGRQLQNMGVDFALMSMLDVLRDPRWGRSEECYSEDPYLSARMAEAAGIVDGRMGRFHAEDQADRLRASRLFRRAVPELGFLPFCGFGARRGGESAESVRLLRRRFDGDGGDWCRGLPPRCVARHDRVGAGEPEIQSAGPSRHPLDRG